MKPGDTVIIAFAGEPGMKNGYTGKAVLIELDTDMELWENEPHWRVKLPSGDDQSYFPVCSIFDPKTLI
jgi:hypothetical protein